MKLTNEYAREVPHYDDIPKSVLAALAFSFAVRISGNDDFEVAKKLMITEWNTLQHSGNGIVPQTVPANLRHLIMTDDELMKVGL